MRACSSKSTKRLSISRVVSADTMFQTLRWMNVQKRGLSTIAVTGSMRRLDHLAQCEMLRTRVRTFVSRSLSTAVERGSKAFIFEADIRTGDVRGGGTTANALVTLIGTKATVGPFFLAPGQMPVKKSGGNISPVAHVGVSLDPLRCSFARGAIASYRLVTNVDLGDITSIVLTHDDCQPGASLWK